MESVWQVFFSVAHVDTYLPSLSKESMEELENLCGTLGVEADDVTGWR